MTGAGRHEPEQDGLNLSALQDRDRGDPGAESDLSAPSSSLRTGGDAAPDDPASRPGLEPGNAPFGTGGPAGLDAGQIATEAGSYGPADGALADAAAAGEAGEAAVPGPSIGDAIHQGAKRGDGASGTPGDRGETGGGGAAGLQGGTGPEGSDRAGADRH